MDFDKVEAAFYKDFDPCQDEPGYECKSCHNTVVEEDTYCEDCALDENSMLPPIDLFLPKNYKRKTENTTLPR